MAAVLAACAIALWITGFSISRGSSTARRRWHSFSARYHFRASAVLGIVGAGGIGFELMAALRLISYDEVAAILLTILVCVVVVDGVGARLRRRLK